MSERIYIENGKLLHEGMVIGMLTEEEQHQRDDTGAVIMTPTIVLNLGWMKLAGVHVRILADPELDRHRNGVVLDR